MPAVIDTPERIDLEQIDDVEPYALTRERPLARLARPGFWRILAHRITSLLTPRSHARRTPVCHVSRPFEAPIDRVIREHPSLSIYAFAII
jgi:hypothetical protein